jgi:hypothetical protein
VLTDCLWKLSRCSDLLTNSKSRQSTLFGCRQANYGEFNAQLIYCPCRFPGAKFPLPHQPREAEGILRGLRGWQNGKSGFNASRSRFGLPPLTFAVSAISISCRAEIGLVSAYRGLPRGAEGLLRGRI